MKLNKILDEKMIIDVSMITPFFLIDKILFNN